MNLFHEEQVIQFSHQAPQLLDPAQERQASKTLCFKNQLGIHTKLQNCREQKIHSQSTHSQTHLTQKAIKKFFSRNLMDQKGVA